MGDNLLVYSINMKVLVLLAVLGTCAARPSTSYSAPSNSYSASSNSYSAPSNLYISPPASYNAGHDSDGGLFNRINRGSVFGEKLIGYSYGQGGSGRLLEASRAAHVAEDVEETPDIHLVRALLG